MSKSKDLFMEMREFESIELSANKKSIIEKATEITNKITESGLITKEEDFTRTLKNATFWNARLEILKENLPAEKQTFYGVEVTPMNGRKMIQFAEDPIYADLQNKLKQREELIKVSLNQSDPVYDSEGIEVTKVSVKYAKDSLNVKF